MEYKLVVAVREDLDLSEGKMAVQVAHAATICALEAKRSRRKWFSEWMKEGQRKVVVRAHDLQHLEQLKKKAEKNNLPVALVQDAGLTEVPPGTVTCLGIGPAPDNLVDNVTGSLRLW